jgi:hypothetical protein
MRKPDFRLRFALKSGLRNAVMRSELRQRQASDILLGGRSRLCYPKIQEPVCGIPHHTFSNAATACRKEFYPREACYGAMWR